VLAVLVALFNQGARTAGCSSSTALRAGFDFGVLRGALHFLNVPHINNRPLKTSLSYAK
jgi:hypothetical protein